MSESRDTADEMRELLAALREDVITDAQAERLVKLLRGSTAARRTYIHYMAMVANLRGSLADSPSPRPHFPEVGDQGSDTDAGSAVEPPNQVDQQSAISNQQSIAPIILDLSPPLHSPLLTLHSPLGSFLFSYVAGAMLLGLGLLIGWTWKIHYDHQLAGDVSRQVPIGDLPAAPLVGRVTGAVDCQWADSNTEAFEHDGVRLGREYVLLSGFLEITYDSGAKVILQGPATYEVESRQGGFLLLGKLTVRVEARAEGGGRMAEGDMGGGQRAASGKFQIRNPKSEIPPSALRPPPSVLFSVRTPTAVVTDLGTEFGVQVERSGATRSCVFQGKVELRPTVAGDGRSGGRPIQLAANESASVEIDQRRTVRVTREAGRSNRLSFARQMPGRNPLKLFNTGVGLKEGDPDPHWEVVARSDDPNFKPRPAVVTAVGPEFAANDPGQSQWISLGNGPPILLPGVACTFRTTLEIRRGTPDRDLPDLAGRFRAYNHVKAFRLNGKDLRMSEPHAVAGDSRPLKRLAVAEKGEGWVEGLNHVELEVSNESPLRAAGSGPILLRVQWR